MKSIVVDAILENLPNVMEFVDLELQQVECSMKAQMQIDVAIEELFVNIANYAYGDGTGKATIEFFFDKDSREVKISFVDSGAKFNPLEKSDPDITLSAEEREVGGLGILMVKKTMDDLTYEYTDGNNKTTIYKKI
ncbi:Anti-sigma regulatory factor (Ser/Thr protein kinase) [Pseudobutyrivibrio sp. YE44]|uniref:ATP-binding protein n=1 Tax=Pseudobutyrivibrio sp. YE44 TaxID=1520802 RepID=UPI000884A96F|nr:ATP-binding protein [Pseudobutyrivibrio sp. YE44]SDB14053.1 Anti-sigma regulatory factor (Ser/Thr protein kinase) [Pseudobutyrivibrio sp. YE44]